MHATSNETTPFDWFATDSYGGYLAAKAIRIAIARTVYLIEDECIDNDLYESHQRGKNWIAYVVPDRRATGGLRRQFWRRTSDTWYTFPRPPQPGDVIEIAGDYYGCNGKPQHDRRYVLVVRAQTDHFVGYPLGTTAPSGQAVREAMAAVALSAQGQG
jgi:hypothetical protein